MIGTLVGAGLSAIGSIWGGISASNAMKKVRNNINQQLQQNEDWYNRSYNEDATNRADAQAILSRTEESIRQRNRAAAGTKAVMGGTDASVAAEKEANNKALADATSAIVVNAEKRKDSIQQQYRQRQQDLQNQLAQLEAGRAQSTSQAIQGVSDAASSIAGLFDKDGNVKE